MVESLKLSITDQQLPMFIRILELIIALYYGEIGGHKEGDGEEQGGAIREPGAVLSGESELSWFWLFQLWLCTVWEIGTDNSRIKATLFYSSFNRTSKRQHFYVSMVPVADMSPRLNVIQSSEVVLTSHQTMYKALIFLFLHSIFVSLHSACCLVLFRGYVCPHAAVVSKRDI